MDGLTPHLYLIPALPLAASVAIALMPVPRRVPAAVLAIASMVLAFLLSLAGFLGTLSPGHGAEMARFFHNFTWFENGAAAVRLGWLLDPLSASMLVMITFVGSLIFIYSAAYMADDCNAGRFFCFLSFFAAAMLGLIIANNLLLLFMCWELVGLASYLLIGFWFQKPAAAAAARKAFITTRIGDIGFFLGLLWLYVDSGTLLFYDNGRGCLEHDALARLVGLTTAGGMSVATAIALLLFCGAVGKSGQVPLHVWLPDAMEGPTPVSALIHAATMVAAGVFLVARMYPLFSAGAGHAGHHGAVTTALMVVTWTGSITAVFAALIAVAQSDIKRILAYSTVSQLGYMFVGLGVGGPAVGMFHLLTHAFFKALLFLGAGSVIHGCHEEQDIRRMGGLWRQMPVTFATYAVGMMALSGVPFVFSGFWSKDAILHHALGWGPSRIPFLLGLAGAVLTAFYMTRQMCWVFLERPKAHAPAKGRPKAHTQATEHAHGHEHHAAHESPRAMTAPLQVLAACTILLTLFSTPVWPWFEAYLGGTLSHLHAGWHGDRSTVIVILCSLVAVGTGIGLGWKVYGKPDAAMQHGTDPVETRYPAAFGLLGNRFYVDEAYAASVFKLHDALARWADALDRMIWAHAVSLVVSLAQGLARISRSFDEACINLGFDALCESVRSSGWFSVRVQNGQIHRYLRILGAAFVILVLALVWMGRKG